MPADVRDSVALRAYGRATEEGARAVLSAVNELVLTPAIDGLASFRERGEPVPRRLAALLSLRLGSIVLEAE